MVFQGDANHKTRLCIWFDEQNSSIFNALTNKYVCTYLAPIQFKAPGSGCYDLAL